MKKLFIVAVAALSMLTAQAQEAFEATNFGSNWSVGVDGGVATPLQHHDFFKNMRGSFGIHFQKQISPVFALGFEGAAGVNTSSWDMLTVPVKNILTPFDYVTLRGHSKTMIDNLYVGTYGSVNLFNLFGGYKHRLFDMELVAGIGWGHNFYNRLAFYNASVAAHDQNYMMTKAGMNFNFNVCEHFTISLKPSVAWNMTGTKYNALDVDATTAAYKVHKATFNCMVGLTYNFGEGFKTVDTRNQGEIDALNAQINKLRGELDACNASVAAQEAKAAALAAELDACKNRKPEVVKVVDNNVKNIRYVFYKVGSSVITADQRPNVQMIADYLKNHKDAKIVVKGYASKEGNLEFNKKLAAARAEAVKTMLVKKYGIAADRIQAEGQGIGEMFSELSWNRVAICTVE